MKAVCLLREALVYRRDAFCSGLEAAGYKLVQHLRDPGRDDTLILWNRYGAYDEQARHWERAGARVVVAENGFLGKTWRGGEWFALALGHHSGAGKWPNGGPERWDSWGVELSLWRQDGETVVLGQRGIGEIGIASPQGWAEKALKRTGGRVRSHPGKSASQDDLAHDLRNAGQVVTWHSGAALLALTMGIPCWHDYPRWIGAGASRPLKEWPGEPKRDDAARLECFRSLAWAQWTLDEIANGYAFHQLLDTKP